MSGNCGLFFTKRGLILFLLFRFNCRINLWTGTEAQWTKEGKKNNDSIKTNAVKNHWILENVIFR
jgi:hypothetical protein